MSSDAAFTFVADHVASNVVTSRVAATCIAVAELDGRPVGALQLEHLWGARPYIALIRAEPGAQRCGDGRALLAFVTEALCIAGHQHLLSSSQLDEPEPQAWHRHMGFVECGFLAGIDIGGVGEVFFVNSLVPAPGSVA